MDPVLAHRELNKIWAGISAHLMARNLNVDELAGDPEIRKWQKAVRRFAAGLESLDKNLTAVHQAHAMVLAKAATSNTGQALIRAAHSSGIRLETAAAILDKIGKIGATDDDVVVAIDAWIASRCKKPDSGGSPNVPNVPTSGPQLSQATSAKPAEKAPAKSDAKDAATAPTERTVKSKA